MSRVDPATKSAAHVFASKDLVYSQEYCIVQAYDIQDLVDKVDEMLALGWQCLGGVSVSSITATANEYVQAMITTY